MLFPFSPYMISGLIMIAYTLSRIYFGCVLANSTLNIFTKYEEIQYYETVERMASEAGIE